jgi:hypothetical protein
MVDIWSAIALRAYKLRRKLKVAKGGEPMTLAEQFVRLWLLLFLVFGIARINGYPQASEHHQSCTHCDCR